MLLEVPHELASSSTPSASQERHDAQLRKEVRRSPASATNESAEPYSGAIGLLISNGCGVVVMHTRQADSCRGGLLDAIHQLCQIKWFPQHTGRKSRHTFGERLGLTANDDNGRFPQGRMTTYAFQEFAARHARQANV